MNKTITIPLILSVLLIVTSCQSDPKPLEISIHADVDIAYSVIELQPEGKSSVLYLKMGDQPVPRRLCSSRSSVFDSLKWVDGQNCLILTERFHEGIHAYEVTSRIDIQTAAMTPILLVDPFNVKSSLKINRDPAKVDPLFLEFKTRPLFSEEYEIFMYERKLIKGKECLVMHGFPGLILIPTSSQSTWSLGPALLGYQWHLSPDRRYLAYTSFLDENDYTRLRSEKLGNNVPKYGSEIDDQYELSPRKAVYMADLQTQTQLFVTEGQEPLFWDHGRSLLYFIYDHADKRKYIKKFDLKTKSSVFLHSKVGGDRMSVQLGSQFTPVPEANCLYYPDNVFSLYQLDLETSSVTKVLDWVGVWAVRPAAGIPGE
ncbi:MAG TPA: hypothetical protein PK176_08455 [Acidobacteriota bacterium]|nr:hypothetical protein [Acidobacteriota bacterium]HQM63332.1 hypothetical protein [Acidobacteriota bacterium]